MKDKQPPHNLEAEMSVIGAILLDPEAAMARVAAELNPDDFYHVGNAIIYRASLELNRDQVLIDLVTLTSKLEDQGKLHQVGGAGYIAQLVDFVPTAANVGYYAGLIRQKAVARRVIQTAREIAASAYCAEDTDALLANAMAALEAAGGSGSKAGNDLLTMDEMRVLYEKHVRLLDKARFVTGFPDVDGVIRGVAPGEVMMITAYSGLFKSAFLQNILIQACHRTKLHHLFFSIEMPATRVFERTCQIAMEEYTYRVESGFHHHEGYGDQTMDELKKLGADKLIVCDRPALTIEQIEHYARIAKARFGELGAVGIDYLGLMAADGLSREYDRISYVAENSKHLAKRLNVPVIILTQIDRNSARDGKVEAYSAKGSGAIEASADYMLGLLRNERKDLLLKILKNRNGEADLKFKVEIDAKYLKFRSIEPYDAIAVKNSERGRERIRKGYTRDPEEYDPY